MEKSNGIHEIEVIYKRPAISEMKSITQSSDAEKIFREMIPEDRIDFKEFFLVALLSRCNRVLGVSNVSVGASNGTVVDVKEILQLAIKTNASSIIVCHNHPSGNLQASENDKRFTEKIKQACKLFEIVLLDHVIISSEGYYSFADNGMI